MAPRCGTDERALPAAKRAGEAQAAGGAARVRGPRARAGLLVAADRPAPGRSRGDRAQPRHRRPARRGSAFQRRTGNARAARGARRARGAARGAARRRAQHDPRRQAGARRPDPRRGDRRAGSPPGGRLRRPRGDRGGAARGRVLRAPAWPAGAAAVRGSQAHERDEPGDPLQRRRRAHPPRRRAGAGDVRRARPARVARRRRARARAAVGGLHAARHRHVRRLRRPPQALALPDSQRRSAGLHAGRGRDDRAGRPLSPQGDARPGAAGGAVRGRGHGAPEPLCRAAAPGRGPRALARSARARRRASRC